jgi:hypothetical protein
MCRGGRAGGFYVARVGWGLVCEDGCRSLVVCMYHVSLVVTNLRGFLVGITVLPCCLFVGDGFWLCLWEMKTSAWINVLVKCGVNTVLREVVQYLREGSSQEFSWVCNLVAWDYSCKASSTRAFNLLSSWSNQITHLGKHFGYSLIISDILVQHSVNTCWQWTLYTLSSVKSLEEVTEYLTFSTEQELRRLNARVLEALQL